MKNQKSGQKISKAAVFNETNNKKEKINKKKAMLCFLLIAGFIISAFTPTSHAAPQYNANVNTQNIGLTGTTLPSSVQYYAPNTAITNGTVNNLNNNNINTTTGVVGGPTNVALPPEAAAKLNQAVQDIKRQQAQQTANSSRQQPVKETGPQDVGYNKMLAEQNKVRILPSTGIEAHNKSSLSYYTEQGKLEEAQKIQEAYRKMYSEKK